jgi:hypothetical protein
LQSKTAFDSKNQQILEQIESDEDGEPCFIYLEDSPMKPEIKYSNKEKLFQ